MDEKRKALLKKWRSNLRDAQQAHYITSTLYKKLNYWVGIPVISFTVFVGSSLFSELQKHDESKMRIAIGIIGVLAAIMASIQTFLRFPEKAEMHRATAVKFGLLKKEIDKFRAIHPDSNRDVDERINEIKQKWDEIVSEAPTVSSKLWSAIKGRDNADKAKT